MGGAEVLRKRPPKGGCVLINDAPESPSHHVRTPEETVEVPEGPRWTPSNCWVCSYTSHTSAPGGSWEKSPWGLPVLLQLPVRVKLFQNEKLGFF